MLSGERLLFRLFNERGVRVFEPTPLAAVCRCSAEGSMRCCAASRLRRSRTMVGDDGMIGVTCEFCSTKRVFDPRPITGPRIERDMERGVRGEARQNRGRRSSAA